jgi:hypothetical protein
MIHANAKTYFALLQVGRLAFNFDVAKRYAERAVRLRSLTGG